MTALTVAGSGVIGSQIAFHAAVRGHQVTVYDPSESALQKAQAVFQDLAAIYRSGKHASAQQVDAALAGLRLTTDLQAALADADLLIEAIPEVLAIKEDFYRRAGALAPPATVFATNTSTLLPSQLAPATGRPERLLALHFNNQIWINNVVEVMGHAGTDPALFRLAVDFVKTLGLLPLELHKEQPGYITNSLIMPWLASALRLWADGVADHQTIDKTWMVAAKSPFVPFAVIDLGGLNSVQFIMQAMAEAQHDPLLLKAAARLKTEFVDQGRLGRISGEGFYRYPDPAFLAEDFLQTEKD